MCKGYGLPGSSPGTVWVAASGTAPVKRVRVRNRVRVRIRVKVRVRIKVRVRVMVVLAVLSQSELS